MKTFTKSGSHLFCGHWNGSPLEIGLTELLLEVPGTERLHYHDYHEYYVILEGEGSLEVEGSVVPLLAGETAMVEPGESHQVVSVGPAGIRWVIVKERSELDNKHIV
jgi:mannose-6-phosphate isomerase-like protein (cupin superfamily)